MHRMSFEEFERRYTGKRYEYVDGSAAPMGPELVDADGEHAVFLTMRDGLMLGNLIGLIDQYVRSTGSGLTMMDVGFLLQHDPPELRGADIAYVDKLKRPRGDTLIDWLPTPPDLVVRLAQPGIDILSRIPMDQDGPRMLWIVNTERRTIEVYRPNQPTLTLRPGDSLEGYDVLPGFTADISAIFAVLDK
jgi:Uma2 family endonuclease